MATLWCLPEEEQVDPLMQAAHPPAPCRVIEITAQVRAKDEADRLERERAQRAAVTWRGPASAKEPAKPVLAPSEVRLVQGREGAKGRVTRVQQKRIGVRSVKGPR